MSAQAETPRDYAGLAISVGRISLRSPFLVAAGPWSAGEELPSTLGAEVAAAGALTSKSVTLHARAGNPEPTVCAVPGGLCNRIGLRNPGAADFVAERLPRLLALGAPVLLSIAAEAPTELAELARQLEQHPAARAVVGYEVNASCPNIAGEPPDPTQLQELVSAAREQTARPLWVKLAYAEPALLGKRARACADAGADALVAVNTVPALQMTRAVSSIGTARGWELEPFLGGLSGASLHPLALRAVWELTRAQSLPVIGCGGVRSLPEALAFFAVGARAVQIGSALYPQSAPRLPMLPALNAQLLRYLDERGATLFASYLEEHGCLAA